MGRKKPDRELTDAEAFRRLFPREVREVVEEETTDDEEDSEDEEESGIEE